MSDTTDPLTDDELDAIQRRCEVATKGPWTGPLPQFHDDWGMVRGADGFPVANCTNEARYGNWRDAMYARKNWTEADHKEWDAGPPVVVANVDFIAHARTDVPRLVDDVRRYKAEVERLRARVAELEQLAKGT